MSRKSSIFSKILGGFPRPKKWGYGFATGKTGPFSIYNVNQSDFSNTSSLKWQILFIENIKIPENKRFEKIGAQQSNYCWLFKRVAVHKEKGKISEKITEILLAGKSKLD